MRSGEHALAAGLAVMLCTVNPGVEREKVLALLPEEVRDTANLYLDGKIDQWYSQQNGKGMVFILNVTDPAAAHEMLEKLPLGQDHLMSFELIPLGPLPAFGSLEPAPSSSRSRVPTR